MIETVGTFVGMIGLLWFAFGMVTPGKALPFGSPNRWKVAGVAFVVMALGGGITSADPEYRARKAAEEQTKAQARIKAEAEKGAEPGPAGVTVSLTVRPSVQNRSILISGRTDLPDGAIVRCEVKSEQFNPPPAPEKQLLIDLGKLEVSGGSFSQKADASDFAPGKASIYCTFWPGLDPQPPHVNEKYGASGEKLVGSNVLRMSATMPAQVEAKEFFEF